MTNDTTPRAGFSERRVFDLPVDAVRSRLVAAVRGAFDDEVVEVGPEHWRVLIRRKGAASVVDVTLEESEPAGSSAVTVRVEAARRPAVKLLPRTFAALAVLCWVALAVIAAIPEWNRALYGPGTMAIAAAIALAAICAQIVNGLPVRAVDEAEAADRLWAELERAEALPRVGSYRGGLCFADPEHELAEQEAALAEAESTAGKDQV